MQTSIDSPSRLSRQGWLWLEDVWRIAWDKKGWLAFLAMALVLAVVLSAKLPFYMQAAEPFAYDKGIFPDYAWAMALAVALGVAIMLWPFDEEDKARLVLLWMAKAALTLLFLPIYEAHYIGLDARMYFSVGTGFSGSLPPLIYGIGTNVVVWLIHWVTSILPAYFHLLEMLWSFVGLIAVYAFYRGWRWLEPGLSANFLLWIGLFPGILFWSSILGKDPIVLLGVGLYFYGIAKWSVERRLVPMILAILGVVMASAIRPWMAVILVAPLAAFPLTGKQLRTWQKGMLLVLVVAGGLYSIRVFLAFFHINDVENLVRVSNAVGHSWAQGGSALHFSRATGIGGIIKFLPLGMFTALFRPLPGDVMNVFGTVVGLLNAGILILTLMAVCKTRLKALKSSRFLWMVLLVLTWSAMYALPSSQNLGTAVRFRLQILPVLWPLILISVQRVSGGLRFRLS